MWGCHLRPKEVNFVIKIGHCITLAAPEDPHSQLEISLLTVLINPSSPWMAGHPSSVLLVTSEGIELTLTVRPEVLQGLSNVLMSLNMPFWSCPHESVLEQLTNSYKAPWYSQLGEKKESVRYLGSCTHNGNPNFLVASTGR